MKIEFKKGPPSYYRVAVEKDELVVASGKTLPYAAWIGTIEGASHNITVWAPASYRPIGYNKAATALLEEAVSVIEAGSGGAPK